MSFAANFDRLARLPDVEATIEYGDAICSRSVRRVAFNLLSGQREPDGDTLVHASARCFLRQAERTFRVDRIATLAPAGADPVASPEAWLREQARGQIRSAPPSKLLPSKAPLEELFVLYTGLEFDALVRVYDHDRAAWRCCSKDLRFQIHEIAAPITGEVRVIHGTDLVTGSRHAIHIDSILHVACPHTGEVASARRQWLAAMAENSLNAGYGCKLFEPTRARAKALALADEIRRTLGSFWWPLVPDEAG